MSKDYNILIKNTTIVDGTGKPAFNASIGIKDEKIVAVGNINPKATSEKIIDGEKLVTSPGFIDIHSHGDMTLLQYPLAECFIMQGVTTIVGGNCGYSPAPLKNVYMMGFVESAWWHEIAPYKYVPEPIQSLSKVNEKLKEKFGWTIDWRTFNQFLLKVEKERISINYVPLVGHNTIRCTVMETDYKRKARADKITEMKEYVREAMQSGSFGLSTGLDYEVGSFSDTDEIVELAKVVKEYNGLYCTHRRYENRNWGNSIENRVSGLLEAIEICRRVGIPTELSHLHTVFTIEPLPPLALKEAAAKATLEIIDKARREGLDITFDVIPVADGGVYIRPNLISILSPWIIELGSKKKLVEKLKVREFRDEVKEAIKSGKCPFLTDLPRVHAFIAELDPYWDDRIKILRCKEKKYENKTIGEIARLRKIESFEALFDILIEDPDTKCMVEHTPLEGEIPLYLKHPAAMIGIDTITVDAKHEVNYPFSGHELPHPNTYGAFAGYIGRYVGELGVLSLEDAIKKATFMPAQKLRLKNRGVIKAGAYADIVVFDLKKIKMAGDYIEPRIAPEGIGYVIVNGEIAFENGAHTGIRSGKVIRRMPLPNLLKV